MKQTMKTATADGHRNSLIAQAAEWRLLSLLLERPRAGWHEAVRALAREIRDRPLRAAAKAARVASEGDYLRLIGPGGAVSPREVTYRPFADPGQLLAQLASLYTAFSFRPRAEEPNDHVSVEAAFVGYLLLKEAFATARGDIEAAAIAAAARAHFIETHLAEFGATFAQRIECSAESYLLPTAQCLAVRLPLRRPLESAMPAVAALDTCGACSAGVSE